MSKYNSLLDIKSILNDYTHDIQDGITEVAQKVAKNGADTLKKTSPKTNRNTKHRGKYAKGWRVKKNIGKGYVNCTIHNATDWQLTHLLEREHLTHNGGKYVPKKKHIEPVHDKCVEDFKNEVENVIKNGG